MNTIEDVCRDHGANVYFDDGVGFLAVRSGGLFNWYTWDVKSRSYRKTGSTLRSMGAQKRLLLGAAQGAH